VSTGATTFVSYWKHFDIWMMLSMLLPFFEIFRRCLKSTSSMTFPNTLPTMIHGEVICTINWFALTISHVPKQSGCLSPCCHLRTFCFEINRKKRNNHMQSKYSKDNDFNLSYWFSFIVVRSLFLEHLFIQVVLLIYWCEWKSVFIWKFKIIQL
jgi:hypothetical protein